MHRSKGMVLCGARNGQVNGCRQPGLEIEYLRADLDQENSGSVAGEAPVGVRDLDGPVGQRGHIGLGHRLLDRLVDLIEGCGADVPLERRDTRLVGVIQSPAPPAGSGASAR